MSGLIPKKKGKENCQIVSYMYKDNILENNDFPLLRNGQDFVTWTRVVLLVFILITTLPLFPGAANWFEQQASKSTRISIPCCFSSTCTIIFPVDIRKYFIMFPSFNHACDFKVHYGNLKSAVQKNIDETYPWSLF